MFGPVIIGKNCDMAQIATSARPSIGDNVRIEILLNPRIAFNDGRIRASDYVVTA